MAHCEGNSLHVLERTAKMLLMRALPAQDSTPFEKTLMNPAVIHEHQDILALNLSFDPPELPPALRPQGCITPETSGQRSLIIRFVSSTDSLNQWNQVGKYPFRQKVVLLTSKVFRRCAGHVHGLPSAAYPLVLSARHHQKQRGATPLCFCAPMPVRSSDAMDQTLRASSAARPM